MDIAQTSTIALTVILVAATAVAGLIGTGLYRARYAATRQEGYRVLAERSAGANESTVEALRAVW